MSQRNASWKCERFCEYMRTQAFSDIRVGKSFQDILVRLGAQWQNTRTQAFQDIQVGDPSRTSWLGGVGAGWPRSGPRSHLLARRILTRVIYLYLFLWVLL